MPKGTAIHQEQVLEEIRDWLAGNGMNGDQSPPGASQGAVQVTLNAIAGNVTTINIPDNAIAFNITPISVGDVYFDIDNDPVAITTSTAATVLVGSLSSSNVARLNQITRRTLPSSASTLRLVSALISPVVQVEFF